MAIRASESNQTFFNGEHMENQHVIQIVAQNSPPWLGVLIGHVSSDMTLSNIALLTSIAYSVVNIWAHFRKKK